MAASKGRFREERESDMGKVMRGVAALALSVAAVGTVGAVRADAAGGTVHGCPYGAVCVYPNDTDWGNDHPSFVYWSYGAHNLSNQYGWHDVLNNQSGGARARLWTGYNGTGQVVDDLVAGGAWHYDLGPVNSITLERP
ncbi:hypothetical protein ACIOC1_24615 [Streptomyces sp. NPDC088197]|uniref:hypothetical protein n=1 Tax=Streptomyces sp. NPDC088197 TaxID=3365840 RepID=UPI0037F129C8